MHGGLPLRISCLDGCSYGPLGLSARIAFNAFGRTSGSWTMFYAFQSFLNDRPCECSMYTPYYYGPDLVACLLLNELSTG